MYRLSASSVAAVTDWLASNDDPSARDRLLAWLNELVERPGNTPSLRMSKLEPALQAYRVPGTDIVVAAIVDDSHGVIDLVDVTTVPDTEP